jgi:hypothetical protein
MSFPKSVAHFAAKVLSEKDLVEVLLMFSTFDAQHGRPRNRCVRQSSPQIIRGVCESARCHVG